MFSYTQDKMKRSAKPYKKHLLLVSPLSHLRLVVHLIWFNTATMVSFGQRRLAIH